MSLRQVIDIEALVNWSLARQCAGGASGLYEQEAAAEGIEPGGMGDWAGIAAFGRLGCLIDRSGPAAASHPDAEEVYAAIQRHLPLEARRLVILHGWRGDRPNWGQRIKPVGVRYEINWRASDKQRVAKVVVGGVTRARWCRVWFFDRGFEIEAHRADYAHWWNGLRLLSMLFRGEPQRLRLHAVTGPGAPKEPWAVNLLSAKTLDKRTIA